MPVKFRQDLLEDYYSPQVAEIVRKEEDPSFSYSGVYEAIQTPDSTIGNNISQNNTQIKMKKGYTVLKLADLATAEDKKEDGFDPVDEKKTTTKKNTPKGDTKA